jgi:hypothetical protein
MDKTNQIEIMTTKHYSQEERARMSRIEYAVAHPTRDNLLNLRSGRDQFTRAKLPELRILAGEQPEIDRTEISDVDKAAAYRWVLRGLPAGLAVKKVIYATELAERRENRRYFFIDEEDNEAREWLDEAKESQAEQWRESNQRKNVIQQSLQDSDDEIVTYLAGAKHYDTSKVVVGPLDLEWEPTNPHDQNAVKIMQGGCHLGYVPSAIAKTILHGSTARLVSTGPEWKVIIKQPMFILPKMLA